MNRRFPVTLALFSMIIAGMSSPLFAQGPDPYQPGPPPAGAQQSPPPMAAPSGRDQIRAERRAQRKAARKACRLQGKQQSLAGESLRSFVKSCTRA